MKGGTENRRKTILAGVLGAAALCCVIYSLNTIFGGSSTPAPIPIPTPAATVSAPVARKPSGSTSPQNGNGGQGVAPGVAAIKMASTSASLDPTLDESAMLRTEGLVYSGSGRNIFSATYTPEPAAVTNVPPPRPNPVAEVPSQPVVLPPPPIPLKFFGTAVRANGVKQAFLLSGEDVYLASAGDIVARKYKIVSIGTSNVQVEDLQNQNTQTLPLQN